MAAVIAVKRRFNPDVFAASGKKPADNVSSFFRLFFRGLIKKPQQFFGTGKIFGQFFVFGDIQLPGKHKFLFCHAVLLLIFQQL